MKTKLENIVYILGMPRAGTTFLYHNLSLHPNIYVPFRRKTNYFSLHKDKSIEWFLNHFEDMKETEIGVDTETLYLADKRLESYKKIKELNSNAKVMLFVRQPDEWVYSFYKQIATFDKNICSFEDFLKGKYILVEDGVEIPFNIKDGDIKKIIEEVKTIYRDRLLLVDFKLFKEKPLALLTKIENFLEIETFFNNSNFKNKKINASNRGHISIVASLLRQQWLIDLLSKLPSSFVKSIRLFYDNISTLFTQQKSKVNEEADDNIMLAKEYFSNDMKYYDYLFEKNNIA